HPLIVSLANTKEVLYLVNRPGNVPSHDGFVPWLDRAIALVRPHARSIFVRGDTDFSHTAHFDGWSDSGVRFVFGMDASPALVKLAESLSEAHWRGLGRTEPEIKTTPRERPENVKERIVKEREFVNQRLESEQVAEVEYQPGKCGRAYRLVIVRKNISVEKGEDYLFPEIRYFFYITNRRDLAWHEVVQQAHERCNQENVIAQLKGGVNAMRLPVRDLESNWAYMVMAALAWNLKAWFGLLMPEKASGERVVKMEFRTFLNSIVNLPAQIIRAGRKIVYRVLSYNSWLKDFFAAWEYLRVLRV
ncbi:MAG: IS1380 family transposase, partial [Candidatus Angelobacter sp.]